MIVISLITVFLSITFGMLGPVVLWLRLSNISDILAHTLIFSLVINYITGINLTIASMIVAMIFVLLLNFAKDNKTVFSQRMTVLSCASIAFTLIIKDFSNGKINMQEFIFGDLYSATIYDSILIGIGLLLSFFVMTILYKKIIIMALSEELAKTNGINVTKTLFIITSLIAVIIASSLKVAGMLLVTSMITIPASVARLFSSSPFAMILCSMMISFFVGVISIMVSINFDVSYAPVFAGIMSSIYFLTFLISRL